MTLSSACLRSLTTTRARARQRLGQLGGFSTRSACAPWRARHFLERRRRIEVGQRAAIGLAGGAVLEHRERGAAHGAVAAVVEHDSEDRQLVHGRNPVADHRIGEHVGAIAERRDNEFIRRREFRAERRAKAPAESAGGPEREKCARLFARAMIRPQRIFIDDDRVLADSLADRVREIFRRNRRPGRWNPSRAARAACACGR